MTTKELIKAEIERRKRDWTYGSSIEAKYKKEECIDILSFLDTLQEPEVDVYGELTALKNKYNVTSKRQYVHQDFLIVIARHFFNLGRQAKPKKIWHNASEKPSYNEEDVWANQILVFGTISLGDGCSICAMIDNDTLYAPIIKRDYKWEECSFITKWAYIIDIKPKED